MVIIVRGDTPDSRPCRMPAMSETTYRCCFSRSPNQSATGWAEYVSKLGTFGDCRGLCDTLVNNSVDRYLATPAPSRLIATPDTMWLTPKVTVATACSRPPRAPNTTPPATAAHGPHW